MAKLTDDARTMLACATCANDPTCPMLTWFVTGWSKPDKRNEVWEWVFQYRPEPDDYACRLYKYRPRREPTQEEADSYPFS